MPDPLDGLNPQQLEAAQHRDGALCIFAGPGSGKTHTLTRRIAQLVKSGVSPNTIMAVTFTRKAAGELRKRLIALIGRGEVYAKTFHAFCLEVLRHHRDRIGERKDFEIADASVQEAILKELRPLNSESEPDYRDILLRIQNYKAEMIKPRDLLVYSNLNMDILLSNWVKQWYEPYEDALRNSNALDFTDFLVETLQLFMECPDLLSDYQQQFHYIHVDEFQDTNWAQGELAHLLAGSRGNICVVGDDDQLIYGWRGAGLDNIAMFSKRYPNAKIVHLDQNYRSTQTIVNVSRAVIECNAIREKKKLFSRNQTGEKITLFQFLDEAEEAREIAVEIKNLQEIYDVKYSEIAVLYRVGTMSGALIEAMKIADIPAVTRGDSGFYSRTEIKDALAWLQVLSDPSADGSARRALSTLKGVGKVAIERVVGYANAYDMSIVDAVRSHLSEISSLTSSQRRSMLRFTYPFDHMNLSIPINRIVDDLITFSGMREKYSESRYPENATRLEHLEELVRAAERYTNNADRPTIEGFIDRCALFSLDIDDDRPENNAVRLSTLHGAKGLEFEAVFLIGVEEDILPHYLSNDLEEERRLFYVGMTRAKRHLYLSQACHRLHRMRKPSRFIDEVPNELVWRSRPRTVSRRLFLPNRFRSKEEYYAALEAAEESFQDAGIMYIKAVQAAVESSIESIAELGRRAGLDYKNMYGDQRRTLMQSQSTINSRFRENIETAEQGFIQARTAFWGAIDPTTEGCFERNKHDDSEE